MSFRGCLWRGLTPARRHKFAATGGLAENEPNMLRPTTSTHSGMTNTHRESSRGGSAPPTPLNSTRANRSNVVAWSAQESSENV